MEMKLKKTTPITNDEDQENREYSHLIEQYQKRSLCL